MFELPMPEMVIFLFVIAVYLAAAIVGIVQLRAGREKYGHLLSPLVSLAVACQAVMLIFRAVAIKAIPLTGLFESMTVLTIVFGLVYLFFSIAIQQVWFGSVMVWVILVLTLLAGTVARPASEPLAIAATPWAIAHGITMILGGASIAFATACAALYLLSHRRLKQKKVMQILGKVPNLEKLEHMNLVGIKVGFILITIGLISGLGLTTVLKTSIVHWLTDSKIILITAAWIVLGVVLILRHVATWKGKTMPYITIVIFVLILFAIVGTTVFCQTKHDFGRGKITAVEVREVQK